MYFPAKSKPFPQAIVVLPPPRTFLVVGFIGMRNPPAKAPWPHRETHKVKLRVVETGCGGWGSRDTKVNGLGGRQAGLAKEGNSAEPQGLREMNGK